MSRVDEIRKRIAKRKRMREKNLAKGKIMMPFDYDDENSRYHYPSYEINDDEEFHPLFNKETFLFKVLASACLFLIVAIIFKQNFPIFEPVKGFVVKTMETEFQFAMVSDWYEKQFGKPLAILPIRQTETDTESVDAIEYALPASARILEGFREDGQKITIETAKGASISAMNEGRVRFIGEETGFGRTVIIQHSDKSETWYGNLDDIYVALYEYIDKGTLVGSASSVEDDKGMFYFALKKGDDFVDPVQVIQFE